MPLITDWLLQGIERLFLIRVALPDWPVWSAINSHGMKKLIVPDSVTEVVICVIKIKRE